MAYISQEIRAKRHAGDLQGAYALARQAYAESPTDKYIVGELSWVLYDCLKRYWEERGTSDGRNKFYKDPDAYITTLKSIANYNFDPIENKMFYENLSRSIGSFAWDLVKSKRLAPLNPLLDALKEIEKAGANYRDPMLLRAFLKGFESSAASIITAVEWYGLTNFTLEDCRDEEYQGKKNPGIAEKAVNAYLDALITKDYNGYFIASKESHELALNTMPKLIGRRECQHWKWLTYKYGKLLLELGKRSEANDVLGSFVLKNPKQDYVWALYGETFLPDDYDMYAACIFRALHLSRDVAYSIGSHEKAIDIFLKMENYPAAKHEVDLVNDCRSEKGWSESKLAAGARMCGWYSSTEAAANNKKLYAELGKKAEAALAKHIPKRDFYIVWSAPEQHRTCIACMPMNSVFLDSSKTFVINDECLAANCKPNETYTASLDVDNRQIYGDAEPAPNSPIRRIFIKEFEGIYDQMPKCGFVRTKKDDVFVPVHVAEDAGLVHLSKVKGQCVAVQKKLKGSDKKEWKFEARIADFTPPDPDEFQKEFEGEIRFIANGIGFVEDCFVPPALIQECDLQTDDVVKIQAVKSWNKKKREWGWRAEAILDRMEKDDPA